MSYKSFPEKTESWERGLLRESRARGLKKAANRERSRRVGVVIFPGWKDRIGCPKNISSRREAGQLSAGFSLVWNLELKGWRRLRDEGKVGRITCWHLFIGEMMERKEGQGKPLRDLPIDQPKTEKKKLLSGKAGNFLMERERKDYDGSV